MKDKEMFADTINGVYDMTWEDVLQTVKDNPICSEGGMDEPFIGSNQSDMTWSIREIVELMDGEIEYNKDEKAYYFTFPNESKRSIENE